MPILTWLIWVFICLVSTAAPVCAVGGDDLNDPPVLSGVIVHDPISGPLVPWRPIRRSRRWMWRESLRQFRQTIEWARQRARWRRCLMRLALTGTLTMATVVDLLIQAQLRRYMGALPVLYGLLEVLQVRQIINRHCPTAADVDHGTVAMVMILNRMVAPRPLYRIADWIGRTTLVCTLVPLQRGFD
jgi:hypothetical protein